MMQTGYRTFLTGVLLVLLSGLALGVPMAAQDEACIRVAGVESSGERLDFDPKNVIGTQEAMYIGAVFNRLMDIDSNFQVSPELARSWEANEDATVWTFQLAEGVTWHDGTPFTAQDVVYTFQRLLDPASESEAAATLAFLDPEGIVAVDDLTVEFRMDAPVVELPVFLVTKNTWIVQDGTTDEMLRATPIGTGPFVPVDFDTANEVFRFDANPNYWEEGLPMAPCVEFSVIQEATSMTAALLSGEIDVAQQVAFSAIPALENNPEVELLETGPATSRVFAMWIDTPPFDDVRVRQALKMVIDRQQMVDTVFLGYGIVGDDNPIPPTSPDAWRSEVPPRDVEGARALLAEAGYDESNPLTFDLYVSEALPGLSTMGQVFVENAAEAGIVVNLVVGPAGDYWDNVWLKQPFVGSGWLARPAGEAFGIAYRSNTEFSETRWFREDFDALLDAANTEPNDEARRALYQQAGQMLTEEGGAIIPVFENIVAAINTACTGYTPQIQLDRVDLRRVTCER